MFQTSQMIAVWPHVMPIPTWSLYGPIRYRPRHCCSAWFKSEDKFQFGPKLNTKVAFNTTTTHPPKTFEKALGKLETWIFMWTLILA